MKRVISFLLSAILVISSFTCSGINAFASEIASGSCGTGEFAVSWSLDDSGTITFTGSGRIPNYSSSNRPAWYDYRAQIKKVIISNGIIQIGAASFENHTALSEVDFGGIDTLGNDAFKGC
ncbi:MAG: hypothetical protein IJT65_01660, partial [Eubacterium sp.]|nr:hypothetical protein [Eubacterium sp.]